MTRGLTIGAVLLCLTASSGCSMAKGRIANDFPELAALASAVTEPEMDVETNGDLVEALLDYQEALAICNGKLAAIRKGTGGNGGDNGQHGKTE